MTSFSGSNTTVMAALLLVLLGTASCAQPGSSRRLLAADVKKGAPASFVSSAATRSLAPELVAMANGLQRDSKLMSSALECSEATGIRSIASDLPDVIAGAVDAFEAYGYCNLADVAEQQERLSYMVGYSVSLHLRSMLLSKYECQGVKALPEQCDFGLLVNDAVKSAAATYKGSKFCTGASTDDSKQVQLLALPQDWQAKKPVYSCAPRRQQQPAALLSASQSPSPATSQSP